MAINTEDYVRPYGPNAPWNIPVAGIDIHEDSDELVNKLWNDSDTDRADRNFNINNTSYTYPVYEVTEDTQYYTVESRTGWGNLDGEQIPFDPSWEPAPGSDGQIIILDPATGREWNLWQADVQGDTVVVSNGNLIEGEGGSDSYFDREIGFAPSRGVGIQYLAMLVRPEEVALGKIEHALSLPIQNTSGSEYFAPATKIEHPGVRPDGIPEGTRFSLDVTYEEIDEHIASLPDDVPDVTKESLRTIMVAMKEYGWFITDTAGGTHFQLESTTSAYDEWEELGMVDFTAGGKTYPRDALDGLMSEDRIVAHVPSDEYDLEAIADEEEDPLEEEVVDIPDPLEYDDELGEGDADDDDEDEDSEVDDDDDDDDEEVVADDDSEDDEASDDDDEDGEDDEDADEDDDGDDDDCDSPDLTAEDEGEVEDDGEVVADTSDDDEDERSGRGGRRGGRDDDDDDGGRGGRRASRDDDDEDTVGRRHRFSRDDDDDDVFARFFSFLSSLFGSNDDSEDTETADTESGDDAFALLSDLINDTGPADDDELASLDDDEEEDEDLEEVI